MSNKPTDPIDEALLYLADNAPIDDEPVNDVFLQFWLNQPWLAHLSEEERLATARLLCNMY